MVAIVSWTMMSWKSVAEKIAWKCRSGIFIFSVPYGFVLIFVYIF